MSEVGKIPNPLNPANDPKKDKHRLGSNQPREKFDYRKKEEASSGSNRQRYSPEEEEEQTPKTAKTPTPDSIFKSSSSWKSSFENAPKKDKHRLGSNQPREKFDYRKKEEASSGGNRQRYSSEEEEQTPKTAKIPTPDSIFKSSSSRKSSFQIKKNVGVSHKEITPSSEKEMQKESTEEISAERKLEKKQIEEKSVKKKEVALANPMLEVPPKTSKASLSKHTSSIAKPKEKKKEETSTSFEPLATIQPNQPNYQPPVLPTGSAFSSYQISQLFDRIAGVMTVMELSGTTTTELTLLGEEFASSVFYGARITITEYSTAPKAFNVQLSANPEAVALFQGSMPNLLANFASGNYAFRVHRLETNVEERPLFKRKESSGSDQQSMQGDS